ncbi:MAG: hypothetical protein ACRAVC_16920 [Trichormus sp.]
MFSIVVIITLVVVGRRLNLRNIQIPWRSVGAIASIFMFTD